jgi:hypothetical protein
LAAAAAAPWLVVGNSEALFDIFFDRQASNQEEEESEKESSIGKQGP